MHLKITFLGWWIPWMFLTPWGAGEWICACCWCCCCCIPFVNVTFRTGCCFGSGGCWDRWGWPSGWKKPASSPPCWNQQHNRQLSVQALQTLTLSSLVPQPARSADREHPVVCLLKAEQQPQQVCAKGQPGDCASLSDKSLPSTEHFLLFRSHYIYEWLCSSIQIILPSRVLHKYGVCWFSITLFNK